MPDKQLLKKTAKNLRGNYFEMHDFISFIYGLQDNNGFAFFHDYCIIWTQEGSTEISINSQSFVLTPNTIFSIRPGERVFSAIPLQEGANIFIISFDRSFLDLHEKKSNELLHETFFNYFLLQPLIALHEDANRFMKNIASKMLHEFTSNSSYKNEILKNLLKVFIIYTSRAIQNFNPTPSLSKKSALVKQFHSMVEKYYPTKKMVKEYAALLQVSASYLNFVVREISGSAASYYIQQRVLREAKNKLIFQGSSMKEIAFSLGFHDQSHFSKYFKNIEGINFTDFKKEAITLPDYQQE